MMVYVEAEKQQQTVEDLILHIIRSTHQTRKIQGSCVHQHSDRPVGLLVVQLMKYVSHRIYHHHY